jgi:hypothetical protein
MGSKEKEISDENLEKEISVCYKLKKRIKWIKEMINKLMEKVSKWMAVTKPKEEEND